MCGTCVGGFCFDDHTEKVVLYPVISYHSQTEIKLLTKETSSSINQTMSLREQKENLQIKIESNEKYLNKITEENKEKEVTENMLRLRADQLEKALSRTGGVVLSLEKQHVELETVSKRILFWKLFYPLNSLLHFYCYVVNARTFARGRNIYQNVKNA